MTVLFLDEELTLHHLLTDNDKAFDAFIASQIGVSA